MPAVVDLALSFFFLYGLQTAAANIKRTTIDAIACRTHLSTKLK